MSNQMESGRGILSIDFGPYPNMESRPRFFEGAKFELAEMRSPLFVTKATDWCGWRHICSQLPRAGQWDAGDGYECWFCWTSNSYNWESK